MDNLGNRKSCRVREVSPYGRLKMYCKHVISNMTEVSAYEWCPPTGGPR